MNNPILVIMAAGLGNRYGGLKQMANIGLNNETIIHYSIYYAYKAGFKKVIFIIRKDFYTKFHKFIGNFSRQFMNIEYVFQDKNDIINFIDDDKKFFFLNNRIKPLGTAHAMYSIKDRINNNFALINADDFYGENAFKNIFNFFKKNTNEQCMISYLLKNTLSINGTVSRGICSINEKNYLTKIKEMNDIMIINEEIFSKNIKLNKNSYVSMNMWGFNKQIFKFLENSFITFCKKILINNLIEEEFTIPYFINYLLENKKINIKIIPTLDRWVGITYKEDLNDIRSYFKEQKIFKKLL